jgi:two-component system sensor histidine kinase AgrC
MDHLFDKAIYLLANGFCIYIIYKFLNIFFSEAKFTKGRRVLAFIGYFCFNSTIHLLFGNPLLNLAVNLTMIFLLTYLFESRLSTRLVATALVYTVSMLFESVVILCNQVYPFSLIPSRFTGIISDFLFFLFVLVVERIFLRRVHYEIPPVQWLAVFFIPLSSLFFECVLWFFLEPNMWVILGTFFMLAINVLVFYLYDSLINFYAEKYERDLLQQQNDAYVHQFEIIRNSQENLRMLRHDFKNHIIHLQSLAQKGKNDDILEYLGREQEFLMEPKEYVYSGNEAVDSILNYKISQAISQGATVDITVHIPNKLSISPFYLNVILANLLDNAIEAIRHCDKKEITVEIKLERGVLYIFIENTFDNSKIICKDGIFHTTKFDKNLHGIGLINVKKAVEKYQGTIDINFIEQKFQVNALIYDIK